MRNHQEYIVKANFKCASPYADDAMNLPAKDVDAAVSFYETIMGFAVMSRATDPVKSVTLARDNVQIAICENGGDPSQEGCFFEVDDVEAAFAELQNNGLKSNADFRRENTATQSTGCSSWSHRTVYATASAKLCPNTVNSILGNRSPADLPRYLQSWQFLTTVDLCLRVGTREKQSQLVCKCSDRRAFADLHGSRSKSIRQRAM